jgi:hypothetical protein
MDRKVFSCEVCNPDEPCFLIVRTIDNPTQCPYGPIDAEWEELVNLSKEVEKFQQEVEAHA